MSAETQRSSHDVADVPLVLDTVADWILLTFAAWTAYCYLAELVDAPIDAVVALTIVTGAAIAYAMSRARAAAPAPAAERDASAPAAVTPVTSRRGVAMWVSVACAGAAAALAATHERRVWWVVTVLAATSVAAAATVYVRRDDQARDRTQPSAATARAHRMVLAIGLLLAGTSLFMWGRDRDDIYYVNRAVAVAERGHIPLRDVLLTDQKLPPVAGTGTWNDTFSVLQGAVARVLHMHAASVAYYLTPPVVTLLATWALWRLIRSWAQSRSLWCFGVGLAYLLFSAPGPVNFGDFFWIRTWEGKNVFVCFLIPTLYVHITRWVRRQARRDAVLASAAGLTAIGLSNSAAYIVPIVALAGCLPLVVDRRWRALTVPAVTALIPFVIGLMARASAPPTGGQVNHVPAPAVAYSDVLSMGAPLVLAGLGLWLGPWLTRDRSAALIALGAAAAGVVLIAPPTMPWLHAVSGLGHPLRRLFWALPAPALTGLLASIRPPLRLPAPARRIAAQTLPLVLVAALVVGGAPSWGGRYSRLESAPTWKTDPIPLRKATDLLDHYHGGGPVLAPPAVMMAIALTTTRTKTVDPRPFYMRTIPQPRNEVRQRKVLDYFERSGLNGVPPEDVVAALVQLRVALVCVQPSRVDVTRAFLYGAGYRTALATRALICFRRAH